MTHCEFTAVLREDGLGWDIFLDGELLYFGLDDQDLSVFARDHRASYQEGEKPWTETERAAYNGLSSADYHNPL